MALMTWYMVVHTSGYLALAGWIVPILKCWCCCAVQVHRLGVGDAVGICTNDQGELVVDANSDEVRQATVRPTYGAAAVPHMPAPPPGKAESFSNGESILLPPLSHQRL